MSLTAKKVDHAYIASNKAIRNGEAVIAGTGIRVMDVAVRYEIMGESPEDIVTAYPNLSLPQVHDALSYYYENKTLIDKQWKESIKEVNALRSKHTSILEKKLGRVKDIHR